MFLRELSAHGLLQAFDQPPLSPDSPAKERVAHYIHKRASIAPAASLAGFASVLIMQEVGMVDVLQMVLYAVVDSCFRFSHLR